MVCRRGRGLGAGEGSHSSPPPFHAAGTVSPTGTLETPNHRLAITEETTSVQWPCEVGGGSTSQGWHQKPNPKIKTLKTYHNILTFNLNLLTEKK